MSPTQTIALTRAKAYLAAAGLPYAVRLPDGTVQGILLIAPEKSKVTRKRVNDFAGPTGYPAILANMIPGTSHVFHAESEFQAIGLRGVVSAAATKLWGKGNAISAVTGCEVEVLRVE